MNFQRTLWTAGCPWDTRPVSRQTCLFLSIFSSEPQELPGTPAGRPLFVRPVVARTPRNHYTCNSQELKTIEEVCCVRKLLSTILGPEMAAPILRAPGKMRPFCRKNHVHKIFLVLGGGYLGFWGGGGSADFIFMGARIFLMI